MIRNYSFSDVKKYLENRNADTSVLDGFNSFLDVSIIFTPIVFGPQFLPLLEVLDVKDRLVEAGKNVLQFIKNQTAPDYKEKMQQIDSAYVTLYLTAFVEALNENLSSSEVKEIIAFLKDDKLFKIPENETEKDVIEKVKIINVIFPNEVDSLNYVKESIHELYKEICDNLTSNFQKIVSKLKDEQEKSKHNKIKTKINHVISVLSGIPDRALSLYVAQLIDLMSSFDDFAAYIQLREFASLKSAVKESLSQHSAYDVGLKSLTNLIKSINKTQKEEDIEKIREDLKKYYRKEIQKPIAGNNDSSNDELAGGVATEDEYGELAFPSVIDAYISQSYKCLRYTDAIGLENPKVWDSLATNENIGDFFINYLSLPQSVEYPLIVLGLPGSGKSILTKVLSAQLMESVYTVIRIPLRDINANDDIHVVISEQITKNIQRPLKDGYAGFAEHFIDQPLFIIFDGYDELLQVKGDIFNGYISKIHEFQKEQNALGRPVRVMVTSRITLIDKVKIPKNSVIVNLEAFDQSRRNEWIKIWNSYNSSFFVRNNIKPFYLKDEKILSKNVKELAEQPLLLLMLALFDSYGNALESMGDNMSRTHLYDELLRRICRREANKIYTHKKDDDDKFVNKYVDDEISRLGVVAIGMFNRKILHIHSTDLLEDLKTYKVLDESSQKSKDADNLIRSFFFVHKSAADNENELKKNYAYEFLHNTFGEFLTADFILCYLVRETGELYSAHNTRMQANIVNKKLYEPDGLGYEWFTNLMFSPLYSRPLVIEMIREHLPCVLERNGFEYNDFQTSLKELVETQLKMILEDKKLPFILSDSTVFQDIKMPLIGHISTYTLNITILAALLSDKGFTFDERNYKSDISQDSETSPWEKLTNLWKTWFSPDSLTGLARIIRTTREEVDEDRKLSIITLKCPNKFDEIESGLNKIEKQLSVANALLDRTTLSLCGLQTERFSDITKKDVEQLIAILRNENPNLCVKYIITLIRRELYSYPPRLDKINQLFTCIIKRIDSLAELSYDVITEFLTILHDALSLHLVYLEIQIKFYELIMNYIRHIDTENQTLFEQIIIQLFKNIAEFIDVDNWIYMKKRAVHFIDESYHNSEIYYSAYRNERLLTPQLKRSYYSIDFVNCRKISYINEDNIYEYMKTSPETASQFTLCISKQRKNKKFRSIIYRYLEYCKHSLFCDVKRMYLQSTNEINNYTFIGIRTLIYSLQIAANVKDENYKKHACKVIMEEIHMYNNSNHFKSMIFSSPLLLCIVVEHIPHFFENREFNLFTRDAEYFLEQTYYHYNNIHLALEYVAIIKSIDSNSNLLCTRFKDMIFKIISKILNDFIHIDENIHDVLTSNEYKNLMWYLDEYATEIDEKIIKKLKQLE